ncbi:MAG: protein translocase subunit SecF, partial [Synergistaceae bacterium]|nr:protein translocase subunit SecF [Synergistaceae bacterium]
MKIFFIDFMKQRKTALLISLILIVASLGLIVTKGLNLGIDFTGGNVVQVEFAEAVPVGDVREILSSVG